MDKKAVFSKNRNPKGPKTIPESRYPMAMLMRVFLHKTKDPKTVASNAKNVNNSWGMAQWEATLIHCISDDGL